jgi:tetratricopeptide (TPR) repeat protein
MTGRLWCSGLCAGLFLVHPLHVESVAWVAERKDVLCGLFWMLGMWGYARYAERRVAGRYAWVLLFFVLALLSKPMAVTFPFVLLLLDYWPLGRMAGGVRVSILPLVWEKVPLLALSAASSAVTFWVQKAGEAVASLHHLPMTERVANAAVSYATYIVKMVWPFGLAAFYPHPGLWPALDILLSLMLILPITALALTGVRQRPWLAVGWFWYLGTLVPVIGIIQVGAQAMADRYTYLPLIGLFIMVIWGSAEGVIARRSVIKEITAAGLAILTVTCLILAANIQVGYWHDSFTLFRHALEVTEGNYQAYNHLGRALNESGRHEEAIGQYREAIRIAPTYMPAYNNMGIARMDQGRLDEAMDSFDRALALKPGDSHVLFGRAEVFARKGLWVQAAEQYRIAIQNNPFNPSLHNNLGLALTRLERLPEAMAEYRLAIRLDPGHAGARNNLAMLLAGRGESEEAIIHFREALRRRPDYANAHYQLSKLLRQDGISAEATFHLQEAIRLNPEIVKVREGGEKGSAFRAHERTRW